jgi:hypothetical protein
MLDRAGLAADPGVVDQDVQPPVPKGSGEAGEEGIEAAFA